MDRRKMIEMDAERRIMNTCEHFNGIQNDACKAGVDYRTLRDVSQPGMARWPCLTLDGKPATMTCAKRSLPTREQAIAVATEHQDRIDAFLAKLKDGKACPHCDAPIESRKVIGRCEYVYPCGHRLGQVGGDE